MEKGKKEGETSQEEERREGGIKHMLVGRSRSSPAGSSPPGATKKEGRKNIIGGEGKERGGTQAMMSSCTRVVVCTISTTAPKLMERGKKEKGLAAGKEGRGRKKVR